MAAVEVLHLVGRSHRRGAELVALELAAELDRRGHVDRVLAVELGHEGGRDPAIAPLVSTTRPGRAALASARLAAELRRRPADVVLAHGGMAAQVARWVPRPWRPPIVWQRILGLGPSAQRPGVRRAYWSRVGRALDGVVALTPAMVDEARGLGHRGPAWVVPNARATDRFWSVDAAAARRSLRAEVGLGADVPLIGLVGHLVAQKDPVAAVEALARVGAAPPAHLVIVGSGPLRGDVERRVRELDLGDRVHLLGHRDDVERVLAGVDLLVLTSRDEGIPGIVIEAAMAACPVVSYPLAGVGEVVDDGATGVIVGRADPGAMAAAVSDLLADAPRRTAMGQEARAGSGRFAIEVVAEAYETALAEVVAGQGRPMVTS